MSQIVEVKVPDIGDYADIPVIDVLVAVGDVIAAEDPLLTVESDKATMDVPSSVSGTVKELRVKVGDKISEGVVIALVDVAAAGETAIAPTPAAVETTCRNSARS